MLLTSGLLKARTPPGLSHRRNCAAVAAMCCKQSYPHQDVPAAWNSSNKVSTLQRSRRQIRS